MRARPLAIVEPPRPHVADASEAAAEARRARRATGFDVRVDLSAEHVALLTAVGALDDEDRASLLAAARSALAGAYVRAEPPDGSPGTELSTSRGRWAGALHWELPRSDSHVFSPRAPLFSRRRGEGPPWATATSPRLCRSCAAPIASQEETCWSCSAAYASAEHVGASAGPVTSAKPVTAGDRWDDDGGRRVAVAGVDRVVLTTPRTAVGRYNGPRASAETAFAETRRRRVSRRQDDGLPH